MAHFIYGVAENTGKGFFTAEDRRKFFLRGYPANVWMVGNNVDGAMWLAEKMRCDELAIGQIKLVENLSLIHI